MVIIIIQWLDAKISLVPINIAMIDVLETSFYKVNDPRTSFFFVFQYIIFCQKIPTLYLFPLAL